MLEALVDTFAQRFGRRPEVAARAPGRVNWIGEHTDYNDGLVLPSAIDRDTVAVAAPRGDGRVRVVSREKGEARFDLDAPQRESGWVAYLQAVFLALRERGKPVRGSDLALASEVPLESGLSSSAALSLAVVTALDHSQGLGLEGAERARVAHRAESEFVGVGCGVMDQLASGLGRRDHALRIDCRSLAVTPVPLPGRDLRLLVAHSGVRRALAERGYAERRAECAAALEAARGAGLLRPGGSALRDLPAEALEDLARCADPLLLRRARHVVRENARVDAMADALARADLASAGRLLREGMRSLRDDFEVSTPELDALCEIADATRGVRGSRLTGAGFGGCTLHLVDAGASDAAAAAIADGFERRFGRRPPVWRVATADGAAPLDL